MKFFQGIHLLNEEKKIDCELLNLGRINVLCGKNNAGKTTLLKLIARNIHSYTIKFDLYYSDIDELKALTKQDIKEKIVISNGNQSLLNFIEDYWTIFSETLIDIFQNEEYSTIESIDIVEIIIHEMKSLDTFFFSRDREIESLIKILFPISKNIFFIDAKRRINDVLPHRINDKHKEILSVLTKRKEDLIECLFVCKISSKDSYLYKYYSAVEQYFNLVTKGYGFDIIADPYTEENSIALVFKLNGSKQKHARVMGLGLQDILFILANILNPYNEVILIEEPENHLNPEIQRELLRFLSQQTDKQFFISTHSSVFLDMSYVDKIYTVFYDDKINVRESTDKADALSELGYLSSDNLLSDIIILTEGKTDIPVLEEFLRKYDLFEENDIKFLSMNGVDNLITTNYDALRENYKKVFVVTDGDIGSKEKVEEISRVISKIDDVIHCQLEGYGIESYLNSRVVQKHYDESQATLKGIFISSLQEGSELFPLDKPVELFGRKGKFESHYRTIANKMTKEDIKKAHDIYDNFIEKVREVCEPLPKKN